MRSLLSLIPFVCISLLAPDTGLPAGGGSAQDAPPAWAPSSDAAPEVKGDNLEQKVEGAKSIIGDLFGKLKNAWDAFKALSSDHKALETQFSELKQTAQTAQTDLATAKGEVTRLSTELGTAKNDLARAAGNITRLESLCQLKGIDTNAVVPSAPAPAAMSTVAEWNVKLANAKGNDAQMKVLEEFQAAVKAGRVSKENPA